MTMKEPTYADVHNTLFQVTSALVDAATIQANRKNRRKSATPALVVNAMLSAAINFAVAHKIKELMIQDALRRLVDIVPDAYSVCRQNMGLPGTKELSE